MATLRTYSATVDELGSLAHWRLNETVGTVAIDSADGLDGRYENGVALGASGQIGDGAAAFDGTVQFVLVETLSGTLTVSAFGDSLIAGDGFQAPADQFSPVLEAALDGRNLTASVIDRGVNGERSADGLARIDDVIGDDPDVTILEFGTNDALGQVASATVQANLASMASQLQAAGSEVLLAGALGFYPDFLGGQGYPSEALRDEFELIYPTLAGQVGGPELLAGEDPSLALARTDQFLGGTREGTTITGGVLDDPTLNVGDGLHPNAAGIDTIVARTLPQTVALGAAAGVISEPLLLTDGGIEVWFTADAVSGDRTLFAKNGLGFATGGHVAGLVRDGTLLVTLASESDSFVVQGGTITAGQASHGVVTFGSGGLALYVDGTLVDSAAYTGGLQGNFEQLVLGADNGNAGPTSALAGAGDLTNFFAGVLDEVVVYDRALSGTEIAELFAAGATGNDLSGTADDDILIGGEDDEILRGLAGDDLLRGEAGADELRGAGDADELRGGAGADLVIGGAGADALRGGAGDDVVQGKDGDDTLVGGDDADELRGGSGADVIGGDGGDDTVIGGQGRDQLSGGAGDDRIEGRDGVDTIEGEDGDDRLEGNGGSDVVRGASGNDALAGNKGTDDLRGGAGDDTLNGGNGQDDLTGGDGRDRFTIDQIDHGVDRVTDFEAGIGGDVLDLGAILDFQSGDDAEAFVGLDEVGGDTRVGVDPDGGGAFVTVFNLLGVVGLSVDQMITDGNLELI